MNALIVVITITVVAVLALAVVGYAAWEVNFHLGNVDRILAGKEPRQHGPVTGAICDWRNRDGYQDNSR